MIEHINWAGLATFIRREFDRFTRVAIQTLITPWISALLYIFIFGYVVGKRIDTIAGVSYIDFVLPGILIMNVISAAFSQSSSSLYLQRFTGYIEEILVAPFSHGEMIIGYVIGGLTRGIVVGMGIFLIAVFFSAANITHFWLFVFYLVSISIVFSLIGIIVALWANHFEHLTILNTFVIMPMSFLGGVFNSISMLPESFQTVVRFNPFFYFIDGIRFAMIGVREASGLFGLGMIFLLISGLSVFVWYLFHIGYGLRD